MANNNITFELRDKFYYFFQIFILIMKIKKKEWGGDMAGGLIVKVKNKNENIPPWLLENCSGARVTMWSIFEKNKI